MTTPVEESAVPPPTVWPTFQARDARSMIDFLETAFGFRAAAVYADHDVVEHAQLSWPEGGGVMLSTHRPEQEWSRTPGTAGSYVVTDHVDEVCRRATAAGAKIISEPQNTDYGNREFTCADPEGNLWSFGIYRGEPG